jgi:endonuclease YncB( thermonuclease family)
MGKRHRTAVLALAGVLSVQPAAAGDVHAADGDSLRLGAVQVRLFGIDAPEARQRCVGADGVPWACGRAAAERLQELVAGQPVRCRPRDRDRYGRLVSVCTAGGIDLGGQLVAEGLARAYAQFSEDYVAVEAEARAARLGLWQGPSDAPWEFRAEDRAAAEADASTDGFTPAAGNTACAIKGNVSSRGDRIYHLPGSAGYARTRIDPARGEAWFCDEAAARAAGFRPPR